MIFLGIGPPDDPAVASRSELEKAFKEQTEALANASVTIAVFDMIGSKAIAEWRMSAEHLQPITLGEDYVAEPTGQPFILAGATFAEFRGDRICAFRSYFDDAALLEQLLLG
jgi:SnoaL-like polyketide cyclase